jgi:protein DEK
MKKLLMLVLTVMINPGTHFNMDLMDRKAEVKRIIEEVINSMSDDEDGDNNSEDEAEGNGKADN